MRTITEERKHINLLVTVDSKYVEPLTVMLRSYIEHNADTETALYIAHSSLGEDDFKRIKAVTDNGNVTVHNVKIEERWFSEVPVLERLPEESFYRLLAFHILPKEVDRCLYLDPDIIIRKPLDDLYNTHLEGKYIAAAGHMHGYRDHMNKARLALKKQDRYINSGIMVMNLSEMRKDFSLNDVLESLQINVQKLLLGDQDMVNILFGQKAVFLPEEIYNLDERTYRYFSENLGWSLDMVAENTAIIHYNGKDKPWLEGYEGELNVFYPEVQEKGPAPTDVAKKHVKSFFRITRLTTQQTIVVVGALLLWAHCCLLLFAYFPIPILEQSF